MKIAIYLLAGVCAILTLLVLILFKKVEAFYQLVGDVALEQTEFRKGLKKEMSKLHEFVSDNEKGVKNLKKRIEFVDGTVKDLRKKVDENDKAIHNRVEILKGKVEEFSDLADESVRAQIDSEKAWAEGVRAIAGFGASIPTLNTKGLEHE